MKKSNTFVVGTCAMTVAMAFAGVTAAADTKTPLPQAGPVEQYRELGQHGLGFAFTEMDELGDRVSQLGRFGYLEKCFDHIREDNALEGTLKWAVCGDDVKALDLEKAKAEIEASDGQWDTPRYDRITDKLDEWKKIGAKIESEAKSDAGIRQVLGLAEAAKAEWKTYLAKNQAAFDRYLQLKAALASGKSNDKGYDGCWEATQPTFAKLVKATKFAWEIDGDSMPTRMHEMMTSTESYITVASFALCATSIDEGGDAMTEAALGVVVGVNRVGWRTILAAKAQDASLKPKFADRSIDIDSMRSGFADTVFLRDANLKSTAIMTPLGGEISKVTKNGDTIKLSFKGEMIDSCLSWVETNHVTGFATNGDPMYQRICKKRGKVPEQEHDIELSAKYAAGLAPGVHTTIISKIPVESWKGKKFVALFGMPMK